MTFQLFDRNLTRAEGESAVRTYHCTSLSSRLLSLEAEGYLTVTNKRVIFYAEGSSYSGKSILQSEVPIADVSGISSYKGNYFRWLNVLVAAVVSFVIGSIVSTLLAGFIVDLMWRTFDLESPQIIVWILAAVAIIGSAFIERERIWRSVLATTGAMLFLGATSLNLATSMLGRLVGGGGGLEGFGVVLAFFAGIYALVCIYLYARRETMSIYVSSKGGASTPIAISGMRSFGMANTAAARALTAEPAPDAEAMIKQLGAMITDIQALGDFGIEKWTAR